MQDLKFSSEFKARNCRDSCLKTVHVPTESPPLRTVPDTSGIQPRKYNIGLYGGSFDPPHKAHRSIAQHAILGLMLRHLYIRPVGAAWYKSRHRLTAAKHRLAMAELNFRKLPRCHIDETEVNTQEPCFTIDALRQLRQLHPQAQIWLIMGGDQVASLHTWQEWESIPDLANLAYLKRPATGATGSALAMERKNRSAFARVHRIAGKQYSVSSTRLRKDLSRKGPDSRLAARYLLPEVRRYIFRHRLYAGSGFESEFASLL